MRLRHLFPEGREGEVIACFGDARLIKTLEGHWELRGGSQDDHREAKEWISLFMHEVVVNIPAFHRQSSGLGRRRF